MIKQQRQIEAYYPKKLLFHIAQDVENYPKFLPHCVGARILDQSGEIWLVENLYRWGPASYKFKTMADVRPDDFIHIQSHPSEKIHLDIRWVFEDKGKDECDVQFEMGFQSSIPLLEPLVSGMLDTISAETERAFLKRAGELA